MGSHVFWVVSRVYADARVFWVISRALLECCFGIPRMQK